jgi:hypothetical protein
VWFSWWATAESATGNLGVIRRTLSVWTVLALIGVLSAVLIGHLWDRYSQETEALGFSGIYERYLASQAGFGDDAQAYRAMSHAGMVQEASALEE